MSTQPEALRLADEVAAMQPAYFTSEVAAELRRLHEVNQELLTALKALLSLHDDPMPYDAATTRAAARAAIAKAEGEAK